ncbi:type II CAAX prenyl endopeptidase Rce1 family protein [Pseudobutyrivibrio sp.]|uniref:CPBP family glutamic-type intramembrane protease n=1 Tax=Pseudobutyrivibrio sp. TaxID=2014367 RepID=UPI00386F8C76
MNQNKSEKGKYVIWVFLPIIIAYVIQIILEIMAAQGAVVYVMAMFKGTTGAEMIQDINDIIASGTFNSLIQVVYAIVIAIVFGFIYKKIFKMDSKFEFFKSSLNPAITITGIVLMAIAFQYICTYLMAAIVVAFPDWYTEYMQLLENAGIGESMSLLMGLYAVLLGPICEELLFRGVTLTAALKTFPVPVAIVLQAVLFGAYHRNMLQGCYTFVFGLAVGYIMYLYDDIVIAIIIHIVYNILGTYLSRFLPTGGNTVISYFSWLLGSLIVGYFAVILLKRGSAKVNNQDNYDDI